MSRTEIENIYLSAVTLPTPLQGVLLPGERVVVPASKDAVLGYIGPTAAIRLRAMDPSLPYSEFHAGMIGAALRSEWMVDPENGKDSNIGGPSSPLKTTSELSRRLVGVTIKQSTTITITDNIPVSEQLTLRGMTIPPGSLLQVIGTAVVVNDAVVVGSATAHTEGAWELVTSGIDWTVTTERRMRLASGEIGFVIRVVDANTVFTTGFSDVTGTKVSPLGETVVVERLPQINCPACDVSNSTGNTSINGSLPSLRFENLHCVSGQNLEVLLPAMFFGCILDPNASQVSSLLKVVASLFRCKTSGTNSSNTFSGGLTQFISSGVVNAAAGFSQVQVHRSDFSARSVAFSGARLTYNAGSSGALFGGCYFEGSTVSCVKVDPGGFLHILQPMEGVAAAGYGFEVEPTGMLKYDNIADVNVTGPTNDVKLGGVDTPYASMPAINAVNNATFST